MSVNILLIGCAGVGKTWVMKTIIEQRKCLRRQKIGKFYYHRNDTVIVVGKYDGSTFEGSDKLSMSVMTDLETFLRYTQQDFVILEGDRFMNRKTIELADPIIIKINGDGSKGRTLRGTNQSTRHLKSISTRVNNIEAHVVANDSTDALHMINNILDNGNNTMGRMDNSHNNNSSLDNS